MFIRLSTHLIPFFLFRYVEFNKFIFVLILASYAHIFFGFITNDFRKYSTFGKIGIFLSCLISVGLYQLHVPIEYFFFPHWVYGEAEYDLRISTKPSNRDRVISYVFFIFAYIYFIFFYKLGITTQYLLFVTLVSLVIIRIMSSKGQKKYARSMIDIGLILSTHFFDGFQNPAMRQLILSFQHYMFFLFYVSSKANVKGNFKIFIENFIFISILLFLFFSGSPGYIGVINLERDLFLFGFIHIGHTYITSSFNPQFLIKLKTRAKFNKPALP